MTVCRADQDKYNEYKERQEREHESARGRDRSERPSAHRDGDGERDSRPSKHGDRHRARDRPAGKSNG